MGDVPEKKSGVLMGKRGYGKMAGAQIGWSKDSMIFSIETMPIPIACSMNFVKLVQSIFLIKKLDKRNFEYYNLLVNPFQYQP